MEHGKGLVLGMLAIVGIVAVVSLTLSFTSVSTGKSTIVYAEGSRANFVEKCAEGSPYRSSEQCMDWLKQQDVNSRTVFRPFRK